MTRKASKGQSTKRAAAPPKGVSRKVIADESKLSEDQKAAIGAKFWKSSRGPMNRQRKKYEEDTVNFAMGIYSHFFVPADIKEKNVWGMKWNNRGLFALC